MITYKPLDRYPRTKKELFEFVAAMSESINIKKAEHEKQLNEVLARAARAEEDAKNTRATLEDYAKRETDLRLENVLLRAKLGGVGAKQSAAK